MSVSHFYSFPPNASDLLDLIKTGHGDISFLLLSHSEYLSLISFTAVLGLRCVRPVPKLEATDRWRTGTPEAALFIRGAFAQQQRQLLLLCAVTGVVPGAVGALGGTGKGWLCTFSSSDRWIGFLTWLHFRFDHRVNLKSAEHLRFDIKQETLKAKGKWSILLLLEG